MKISLTENEIRDINRYLSEGKPLPEKYRFLLFEDKREVELAWNGKTNEVTNVTLPFQIIEQVDEPRAEIAKNTQMKLFDVDERGRQKAGWTNKLIWGDNKLILSSLKNGPLREEIEKEGGIKLIYIDPPFDVGADFSMDIPIGNGDESITKEPSVLEELAYRDTWGKGADSFIAMIYERLSLMKDLLAEDGSIFVHCDYRVSAYIKLILDELFNNNIRNEIIWCYHGPGSPGMKQFNRKHDTIYWYNKTDKWVFNNEDIRVPLSGNLGGGWEGLDEETRKEYAERGKIPEDWWEFAVAARLKVDGIIRTGYPTEKPNKLLERILLTASKEGDLVADFFCGSGSFLYTAELFERKWIGTDIGKFSIHTTRKRLIGTQRELKLQNKNYRAFEILNLGKYERQHYVGVNPNLREEEKHQQLIQKEKNFVNLILRAYRAEKVDGFKTFQGKKADHLVSIGPINTAVTRLFVESVISEAREKRITKVDVLAFEFEMGLAPNVQEDAKRQGIDLSLKYIPREVFDKRAVEKNQVVFSDVSYIEVRPIITGKNIAVELTDFSVFYNQDALANVEENIKDGGHKIIIENGQIVKILKDKSGNISRESLTKKWTDWVDYWSVDFNFENKKEIIKIVNEDEKIEEVWTGSYIFENEWQSFRTKKNRNLELVSMSKQCLPGNRKIAIKVIDIFGNDTMKVIDVKIGGK